MKAISPVLPSSPGIKEIVLAEQQPEYLRLPVACPDQVQVPRIARYRLTPEELAEVAKSGCVWVECWTFGSAFHPQRVTVFEPGTQADVEHAMEELAADAEASIPNSEEVQP